MEEKKDIKLPEFIYINPRRQRNKMTPQFETDHLYEAHQVPRTGFVKYKKVKEEEKGK